MKRIQERIDHMLENALWLARNYPELFKDETSEIISIDTDNPLPRHRRLTLSRSKRVVRRRT